MLNAERIFKILRNMCAMNHNSIMNLYTQYLYRESYIYTRYMQQKGRMGPDPNDQGEWSMFV